MNYRVDAKHYREREDLGRSRQVHADAGNALPPELTTRANYSAPIRLFIISAFGDRALASIRREEIDAWERALIDERGYSAEYIRGARRRLHTILADAVTAGRLQVNPAARQRGRGRKASKDRARHGGEDLGHRERRAAARRAVRAAGRRGRIHPGHADGLHRASVGGDRWAAGLLYEARTGAYAARIFRPAADGVHPAQKRGRGYHTDPWRVHCSGDPFLGIPVPMTGIHRAQAEQLAECCWAPLIPGLTPHGLRHGHQTAMRRRARPRVLRRDRLGHGPSGDIADHYTHIDDK